MGKTEKNKDFPDQIKKKAHSNKTFKEDRRSETHSKHSSFRNTRKK